MPRIRITGQTGRSSSKSTESWTMPDAAVAAHRVAPLLEGFDRSPGQGPDGDCHEWTGATLHGYGLFWNGSRPVTTHRAIVGLFARTEGVVVAHRCDNPPCGRLEHLFCTDTAGNNADRDQKGRVSQGELHARSKLTKEDVVAILAASATINHAELARVYGVTRQRIGQIRNRRGWKHIT